MPGDSLSYKFSATTEFEIITKIAEGGMGQVFKARHKGAEGFEKIVAIKTMKSFLAEDDAFIEKFIAEAKLVANLIHENIVQIYQLGRIDNMYYFVLEFVNGISLEQFIEHHLVCRKNPPPELAVYICSRVARGLAYAHSRTDADGVPMNIVHCDICPANILITDEGLPKITDFGIAKVRDKNNNKNTTEGKPLYMSPEQARGEIVTPLSDIYTLGILLFILLSGKFPRDIASSTTKVIINRAGSGEINWEFLPEDLDPELKNILLKMLAPSPEHRYQSSAELAAELEYHIYKDGYGPTIVTMANYMRKEMPALLDKKNPQTRTAKENSEQQKIYVPTQVDKTRVIMRDE